MPQPIKKKARTSKAKPSTAPNLRKLLTDKSFSTGYKGIKDDGKCVMLWLTGYSQPDRQLLFELLWKYLARPEDSSARVIATESKGSSLLVEKDKFTIRLIPNKKVKYDQYAVEVVLSTAVLDQELQRPYGFCPRCGAPGVSRERRPDGNDKCQRGCTYPSSEARADWAPQRYSLGFIPRDKGVSRIIRKALALGQLQEPLLLKISRDAPMKPPKKPLLNIKIAIPYGNTVIVNKNLISLDEAAHDYKELNDIVDLL